MAFIIWMCLNMGCTSKMDQHCNRRRGKFYGTKNQRMIFRSPVSRHSHDFHEIRPWKIGSPISPTYCYFKAYDILHLDLFIHIPKIVAYTRFLHHNLEILHRVSIIFLHKSYCPWYVPHVPQMFHPCSIHCSFIHIFVAFIKRFPGLNCHYLYCTRTMVPSNIVLLVKIEGSVWYTIYHHLPIVQGVSSTPLLINQPMGKGHLWFHPCSIHFFHCPQSTPVPWCGQGAANQGHAHGWEGSQLLEAM